MLGTQMHKHKLASLWQIHSHAAGLGCLLTQLPKHHAGLSRCQILSGVPMWPKANDAVGFSDIGDYGSPLGAFLPREL